MVQRTPGISPHSMYRPPVDPVYEVILVVVIAVAIYLVGRYFDSRRSREASPTSSAPINFPVLPASPIVATPQYHPPVFSSPPPHPLESPPVYSPFQFDRYSSGPVGSPSFRDKS